MMMYTIDIPKTIPLSLNKMLRLHWRARNKLKSAWMEEFYAFSVVERQKLRQWASVKLQMTVRVIIHHSRAYDPDSLVACVKPCLDGLVCQRFLWDDAPDYLNLIVEQQICPHKQRHTVISIGVESQKEQQ